MINKSFLFTAIRASIEAGTAIMKIYSDPEADFEIERKADNSPLTIADRTANRIICDMLEADTPYPILSEEGSHAPVETRQAWTEMWVVDPLDGTKEFIKRNGEFTVNIAYVKDGRPEAGVIYIPAKRELYFGSVGDGAYKITGINSLPPDGTVDSLKDTALRLPLEESRHGEFVVVASRSHLNAETEAYIEEMKCEHGCVRTVSRGSSLKLCLVAEGVADVYPRFAPTMEWDTAAGHAIAAATGACEVVRADDSQPLTYNKADLHNPWFIVRNISADKFFSRQANKQTSRQAIRNELTRDKQ